LIDPELLGATRLTVQPNEALENHPLLHLSPWWILSLRRPALLRKTKDTKSLRRERFDVGEDILLQLLVERDETIGHLDLSARVDDALDGTLHEDELLFVRKTGDDDGHCEEGGQLGEALEAASKVIRTYCA
jgi:hypothetical protein